MSLAEVRSLPMWEFNEFVKFMNEARSGETDIDFDEEPERVGELDGER